MSKKIIIREDTFKRLMMEEFVNKTDVISIVKNSPEMKHFIEDMSKDALKNDKALEKKVKEIVANSVNTLFRTLWQRSNFYEDEIKR